MRWLRNLFVPFVEDSRGVTSIEFALLVIPFLALSLGVIEISRAISTQGMLTRATDIAVRDILICKVNVEKLTVTEIEAYVQSVLNENTRTGMAANASVSRDSTGSHSLRTRTGFRFIAPLFRDKLIEITVKRTLISTCRNA
jgi:Flp pilus assembly protein TadG